MKVDLKKTEAWMTEISGVLSDFRTIISGLKSPTLVVGAAVLEFYAIQGWIPPLSRSTGDLDLSVGLKAVAGTEYNHLKKQLGSLGYKARDPDITYRFYPVKQIPGAKGYIDLLAHPITSKVSDDTARRVMGAGPNFSFEGFAFAQREAFEIAPNLLVPNPIAFMRLKIESYKDAPLDRKKDFADIVELITGLVSKGIHYDLETIYKKISGEADAKVLLDVLKKLEAGSATTWDIDDIQSELVSRNLRKLGDEFEQKFAQAVKELNSAIK